MTEEMKEALKEYIKDNLSITVDVGYDYGYNGRRVEVTLSLEGEKFAYSSDSLPDNN
ncbi:hypothetical protein psageK4_005c [Pseudomonas phage psageK4]|uniref:Uncharacterized protein n=1 Tax=Pseudomonas phage psageK4 TaxID=2859563 RepID=A0ABX8SP46_9CAUD|nr:hypothetical protein QGX14_gp005 [Pseudomonas phage psageK4]QXV71659.1 hypothetical protein psageK4_005c [Pseudomonas phage psageK4]